jgi:hypothetical protein
MRKGLAAAGLVVALCASSALAGIPSFQISIGVRETAQGGGPDVGIGNNGGTLGGIEWLNLDGATLPFDGAWHQFSFDMDQVTATAFAGATANSILEGAYGVLEHIRIRNIDGVTSPIALWVDEVANTTQTLPFPPSTTTFGSFEAPRNVGDETIFQEPRFSGSTAAFLDLLPNTTLVANDQAHSGVQSDKAQFRFINSTPTNWLRLTTFHTGVNFTGGNPMIRFDQNSVVSFWLKATPEPTSLALLALGGLVALRRRS